MTWLRGPSNEITLDWCEVVVVVLVSTTAAFYARRGRTPPWSVPAAMGWFACVMTAVSFMYTYPWENLGPGGYLGRSVQVFSSMGLCGLGALALEQPTDRSRVRLAAVVVATCLGLPTVAAWQSISWFPARSAVWFVATAWTAACWVAASWLLLHAVAGRSKAGFSGGSVE
jgi:hypothetical protein